MHATKSRVVRSEKPGVHLMQNNGTHKTYNQQSPIPTFSMGSRCLRTNYKSQLGSWEAFCLEGVSLDLSEKSSYVDDAFLRCESITLTHEKSHNTRIKSIGNVSKFSGRGRPKGNISYFFLVVNTRVSTL